MIRKFECGHYATNTYLISKNNHAIIIDPGFHAHAYLLKVIAEESLTIDAILITHGHADHIDSVGYFDATVYIGIEDKECLYNPNAALYHLTGGRPSFDSAKLDVKTVTEDSIITFLGDPIKVIETPGHAKGAVCYLYNGKLFSGDTLFLNTVGRTDIPRSEPAKLYKSLEKLMKLPNNTKVYPGHGDETTILNERKNNPFILKK